MSERRHNLFFPMALIAVGLLWLLINLGYIPSANLWALTHIWPLFLIGAGLSLILRNTWAPAGIVISALMVAGAVAVVLFAPQLGWDNRSGIFWNLDFAAGGAVRGSGNLETEVRSPGEFSAITIRYPAEVRIVQGESESVSITADDNLLPQLGTEVSGGVLVIDNPERNWGSRVNPSEVVQITITVQALSELTSESAGSVNIAGLSGGSLKVTIEGAGDVKLNGIELTELETLIRGVGNIDASGTVDQLNVQIEGLGNLNAEGLTAQEAYITVEGLGNATVRVVSKLHVQIDGLGSVNYFGSPTLTQSVDGLGSVKRSGD